MPTNEQVMSFAKAYGSYVGEVYLRNHAGGWGMVAVGENRFPDLRPTLGSSFWPWGVIQSDHKGRGRYLSDYYVFGNQARASPWYEQTFGIPFGLVTQALDGIDRFPCATVVIGVKWLYQRDSLSRLVVTCPENSTSVKLKK
jgi:hypothetical protein